MKTTIIILIGIFCLSFIIIGFSLNKNVNTEEKLEPKYQGPVPEGYNEEHFRKTGLTKPLEVEK